MEDRSVYQETDVNFSDFSSFDVRYQTVIRSFSFSKFYVYVIFTSLRKTTNRTPSLEVHSREVHGSLAFAHS